LQIWQRVDQKVINTTFPRSEFNESGDPSIEAAENSGACMPTVSFCWAKVEKTRKRLKNRIDTIFILLLASAALKQI
jgi:hypothetical protein